MKASSFIFRIEASASGPIVRLRDEDLANLSAAVGDVLIMSKRDVRVTQMSVEAETQTRIAFGLMDEHRGVLSALAKT